MDKISSNIAGVPADEFIESLDERINESKSYWDKEFKLDKRVKENVELYLGEQVAKEEDEYEDVALDNRIFSSIRTIVPYVTSRVTEPEVYPSSTSPSAKKFAEDIEKALYIHAKNEKLRMKTKFALEDAIIRRRGYLKPRYDATRGNFCTIEYVPAESIIIDHKARPYEEPRYFRHVLDKPVEDLKIMFPDMIKKIEEVFGVDENTSKKDLTRPREINEDWVMVPGDDGLDLVVCWSHKKNYLGAIKDPNWNYEGENFLDYHMMPLVFFNVLSDGRSFIDRTSFVEQAKFLQKNVDKRSRQISKNAGHGNIGMPVVDSAALADDQAQYLTFEPDTVLELDVKNAGGSSVRDVFDVWRAGTMPNFVYEDKIDSRNSIDNTFGTPNVFRGEQSTNNTLGQDVLVRDQAFGRQQEIVDAIDNAFSRLYVLMAQFLLIYGSDQEELFEFVGENGEFDYVLINTAELDTKIKIQVKSGTSMPIDREQRRATADKAAQLKMIDPLTYWEIMDEGNADKYARRLMDFTTDPMKYMKDDTNEVFNRDAFVDIQILKNGGEPPFRENLPKEYFDYLNQYVLSGDLENPMIPEETRSLVSQFIDAQLARGQKMLGMAESQLPTPDDVNSFNQQVDEANKAQPEQTSLPLPQEPAIA